MGQHGGLSPPGIPSGDGLRLGFLRAAYANAQKRLGKAVGGNEQKQGHPHGAFYKGMMT